ncbi:hypothetical protein BOTBODRAFT_122115 [Botryobasidium botryosum FD-172 SS1]|uniref:cDENN domain-containing protein n=1 Tax=Botryobasidium botryosum (strain FD-172 SS1) TaxID=930990 RepID=A0A067LRS7_BOTB1|nr:hypothetical protein BOTBODRAFT_122115 [Botryobasidium botryosum FD-172 SS1]
MSSGSSRFLSISPARAPSSASSQPATPLTTLYLVSGLPKSPQTWTLADADSVTGLNHTEGAVGRFWRAEVLGSSVTPGIGGKKKKKRSGIIPDDSALSSASLKRDGLSKSDLGKMLSKSLKLSFTREVEIIASTLQPASTVHTFTFQLQHSNHGPMHSSNSGLRTSVLSNTTGMSADRSSMNTYPYPESSIPQPSSAFLGPPPDLAQESAKENMTTYHAVCLTVWSHADEERSVAIRRALENAAGGAGRSRHISRASKISSTSSSTGVTESIATRKKKRAGPWSTEVEESDTEGVSESDADGFGGPNGRGAGASSLFLPQNTVFWLPYALTLVSRHPIYDLMRDYLTLSWARFSKDVQSHTLQIAKILEHPAPRAGEIIRLDAGGAAGEHMEVVCRFPGGLDFGRGLVDVNFTMWPLFRCLNIDNILTICEIALSPTGRVIFLSRHPAMLGIAVSTIKYLVELRGWNGVALPIVHSRDAKIYVEDPGPWLIGLGTEARYVVRPAAEVCVCDLDINYVHCPSPPVGVVSVKQQRDKFRRTLAAAFDQYYHPDHSVPSEFKEAFPAGRFRPLCKIQSKKGTTVAAVAESIRAPEWWHQTRVVQAFDAVLKDKYKKPTLLKRLTMMGMPKRQASLTTAEQLIQLSIRKRATAFVDARDDLETKIGRLSRRLNFLMTESDLWREKFVAFEGYAEKLSAEAAELRSKIGKEQRESKRLSGLVSITSQEKAILKAQLIERENAHREAMIELERMRVNMDEMERERAQMVAEVEAQIEKALQSMAFSDGLSISDSSRPGSVFSTRPNSPSVNSVGRPVRSIGTASTLAGDEDVKSGDEKERHLIEMMEDTTAVHPAGDGEPLTEVRLRKFSATHMDAAADGLKGMDHGITEKSDQVAQKVLQIQQKVRSPSFVWRDCGYRFV